MLKGFIIPKMSVYPYIISIALNSIKRTIEYYIPLNVKKKRIKTIQSALTNYI